MKREALNHTKMKRLCRRLDIPIYHGVGIMESLWQLAAREAPRGDIGKLSNEDIAIGIDYRDDEAALVDALIHAGWLENSPEFRLIIHDWDEHADDAVHMRLARARAHFCSGRAPKLARLGGKERTEAQSYYTPCAQIGQPCAPPEPRPARTPPEPEPKENLFGEPKQPTPLEIALRDTAKRMFDQHPVVRKNIRLIDLEKKLAQIVKPILGVTAKLAKLKSIDHTHLACCNSEKWTKDGGEFANGLRNWLAGGMYERPVIGSNGAANVAVPQKELWPGQLTGSPNPGLVGPDW